MQSMFEISSQIINLRCFKLERVRKKTLGISLKKKEKSWPLKKKIRNQRLYCFQRNVWLVCLVRSCCVEAEEWGGLCWALAAPEQWALLAVSVLSPRRLWATWAQGRCPWCLNTRGSLKSFGCFNGRTSKFLLSSIPESKVNWIYSCSLFLTF